jgi:putative endonuclease
MEYNVYILRSLKNRRHYTGITTDLERRLTEHNNGDTKSTRAHTPYERIWESEEMSRSKALKLEIKIKKRGAARFLANLNS